MPIDTSMYSQLRTPDPINPEKILTLAQVARQGQINDLAFQDQMATRNAFKNNLVTDQNGNTTVNRQGVLSDLMKQNPQKAMEAAQSFRQMDLARLHDQTQLANELAAQATPDNWGQIRQQAQSLGLDNADKLPQAYDPKFVDTWKMHTQNAKDQFAQVVAQQNAASERGKTNAALSEAGQPTLPALTGGSGAGSPAAPSGKSGGSSVGSASGLGFNPPPKMQQQALDQLGQHILSSRSIGSVKLAYQDGYQSQKGLVTIASALGHPNAQQSALVASDMGKIAQGGAPTESELKDFDPATLSGLRAKVQQYLSSHPTDTGNAALMNVAKQYFSDIADNSRNIIRSSNKKAINFYGNWLSPKDRATAIEQFVNGDPLDNSDGGLGADQAQGAPPPQTNGIPPLQDLLAEKARRAAKGVR